MKVCFLSKYMCCTKIIIIVSILLLTIGEYKTSEYANALYVKKRSIKFGVKISKCVDVILTNSEDLFYIYDDVEYYMDDNLPLHVKKLCGYGIERDSMFVLVDIGQNDYVSMGFGCAEDVERKTPILTCQKRNDVDWILLHQMPCYVYYWRFIAFMLTINLVLCTIAVCIQLVKIKT